MRMGREKSLLKGEQNIEEVLEFLKSARMLRKQAKLIKGIQLSEKEETVVRTVLKAIRDEITLFKI